MAFISEGLADLTGCPDLIESAQSKEYMNRRHNCPMCKCTFVTKQKKEKPDPLPLEIYTKHTSISGVVRNDLEDFMRGFKDMFGFTLKEFASIFEGSHICNVGKIGKIIRGRSYYNLSVYSYRNYITSMVSFLIEQGKTTEDVFKWMDENYD